MRDFNRFLMFIALTALLIFVGGADGNLDVVMPGMLISGLLLLITYKIEGRYEELDGEEDVD